MCKVLKSYVAIDLAFFFLFMMLIFSMTGTTFWSIQNIRKKFRFPMKIFYVEVNMFKYSNI